MEDIKDAETRIRQKAKNPYLSAGILSKLFFTWVFPLFYKGFRRGLKEEDIFLHLRSHDSRVQGNKLEKEWRKECDKSKHPSLLKALFVVYGKELMLLGVVNLVWEMLRISLPLVLDRFLDYYEPNTGMTLNEAYIYASLLSLTTLAQVMISHYFMYYILHLGQKIRSATSSLVYRKAIRLSKSALAETTIGQMVNLISNDVSRFELCTVNVHSLWLGPLELVVVLILLYYYVGFTGIPGAALLVCFIPFQMWMGKKTSLYRLKTAIKTDERIRLMNEIIIGMQVIKMYTWEKPFAKLVKLIRMNEMDQIKNNLAIRGIMMAFNVFLTRAVIASCILTYVLTGNILNAKYVYVVSLFFEILRQSINQGFTLGVTQFAEAIISMKRIQKFLMYDEIEFQPKELNSIELEERKSGKGLNLGGAYRRSIELKLSGVSVKWIKSDKEYAMKNINFSVENGELATVIGKVGSGKSTLLHIILRELPPITGSVNINGRTSYASQEAWLFMGSVKQNILFGQNYDPARYNEVIRVCGLQRDLNLLPYGDRTLVGERGISLSGGQKARINLARAIYKEADIYLLDDPLSAVDTHVGKHIFEECILGYLKNKCVVLVTHQLQYLKDCKKIYLLKDGAVDYCGTYEEMESSGKEFTSLIKEFKEKMEEEAKREEEEKAVKQIYDNEEVSNDNGEDPTVEKEGKIEGIVTWAVYKYYFLAGGHWYKILGLFLLFVISQALASGTDYFLTIWVNVEQVRTEQNSSNISLVNDDSSFLFENFWLTVLKGDASVITYGVLVGTVVILLTIRSLLFFRFCVKSSIRLHDTMFNKIVCTSMRFFNINPSGRILNRFSKDMNQVDEYLPVVFSETLQIGLMGAAITIVVATLTPFILLPTAIILIIYYVMRIIFIATTRDIKRFEAITRSPVYSHLTASLQGLTTIRAFGAQQLLKHEFDDLQNAYNSAYFMFLAANRTFGFWLDMQSVIFVTLVVFSFLLISDETFGGNVGLAITQAITLTGLFQFGIRQWSEMENTMTCVERIKEYSEIQPENDVNAQKKLPENWPEEGFVKFDNLCLRYSPDVPYVLKNLRFSIQSNEKIGIVGRTGAGKSSMIAALFRLVTTEGQIFIDNVDTKTVPLKTLRSKISIIPQEPVLFSGTMRKNLDPFDEYSDEVLWNALDEVKLKQTVSDLPLNLQSTMSEGGSNFSVGQRQLVCLARAIIRKNKILVLDEATANVDPYTDGLIQATIRRKFSDCTVLTIAHRLHTIMDSDKVMVMDAGQLVEFGHPYELLQNKGILYGMVQQTGKAMAENLISIAKNSRK